MSLPRRRQLVLLLDGTWNKREDSTNVWRTRLLLRGGRDQLVYYDQGVGTVKGEEFSGGALGSGLTQKVLAAYLWLMENYLDDQESPYGLADELFVFGFSRGAFTARSLVGLLSIAGIPRHDSLVRVRDAFELSRTPGLLESSPAAVSFRRRFSRLPIVRFLGVWDTVEALGLPRIKNPFAEDTPKAERAEHKVQILPSIVTHARHALALDEHRWNFRAILWERRTGLQSLEQRWFIGAHANVGGGYALDALFIRPLFWMLKEAERAGLELRRISMELPTAFYLSSPRNSLDEAMLGLYYLAQWGRPYSRKLFRLQESEETVDYTVLQRWLWDWTYRPRSLRDHLPPVALRRPSRADCPLHEALDLLRLDPVGVCNTDGYRLFNRNTLEIAP